MQPSPSYLGEKALLRRPISSSKQFSVYGVAFASMLFNQSPRFFQAEIAELHQVAPGSYGAGA